MAKEQKAKAPSDHAVASTPAPTDFLVGLRAQGGGYALVTAQIQGDDVRSYVVDTINQPLQFASQSLLAAIRKLVSEIP